MPLGIPVTNFYLHRRGTETSEGAAGPRAHTQQGARPPGSQLRPISRLSAFRLKRYLVLHLLLSKESWEGAGEEGKEESKRCDVR